MTKQAKVAAAIVGVAVFWIVLWIAIAPLRAPRGEGRTAPAPLPATHPAPASPSAGETLAARESLADPPRPEAASEGAEGLPPAADPGVRVFGNVLDAEERRPFPGRYSLRFVDSDWESRSTEASGAYEIEGLHPGHWEVTVEALGAVTIRQSVEIAEGEAEQRFDFFPPVAPILKVRIEGEGPGNSWNPLIGRLRFGEVASAVRIVPVATRDEPSGWLDPGETRCLAGTFVPSRGRHLSQLQALGYGGSGSADGPDIRMADGTGIDELPEAYCGVLALSEPLPVHASLVVNGLVLQSEAVAPGRTEVVFSLSEEEVERLGGRVRLSVVDELTDLPPAGLRVLLDQRLAGRRGTSQGSDGSVEFRGVAPGAATLKILADDRAPIQERVLVQPGDVTDLGAFRVQPFSLVRAKVLDDEDAPAQVMFHVFPLDRYEETREVLAKTYYRSSRDGDLKIDSLGRGRYLIVASEEGWVSVPALADTTFCDVEDLRIRVSRGTRALVRLRADPLPGARLAVRTRDGLPVEDRRVLDRDPVRFLLAPGTYSVELWKDETWLATETLSVGEEPVRMYFPR